MALAPVAYWIYDNNHITIEEPTSLAFSEDVATRYQSSGWNVTRVGDANDLDMVRRRLTPSRRSRPNSASSPAM